MSSCWLDLGELSAGLCSPDLQTPNALDYFTLLQGTEMVTEEGTEAVLSQGSLHSPGPAEQRPRGFCSPLFNSFMPNELNVHLIFPGNNAFLKKQTVLSSCLFQLSLQLFSTAFTNYFKSFLGIHSPQSRLAVAQTKKLREKKCSEKIIKPPPTCCRLIRFQMVEKSNSSELLCERLWAYLFLFSPLF